jgi:DNA-directed RNA polymerase subunit F
MIGKRVEESRAVPLAEVSDILETRKTSGEVGFEQQACLDYANKFKKISKTKAAKLTAELMKNEKIKEATAVKIVDILPRYDSQLAAILQKDRCDLSKAEIETVLKEVAAVGGSLPVPKPASEEKKEEKKEAKEEKKEKASEEKEEKKAAKEEKEEKKTEEKEEKKASKEEKEEKEEKKAAKEKA